jgi:hypothetical protein
MTKYRRSLLGGHFAGTGMESPTSKEFDDFTKTRTIKIGGRGMLPTDQFVGDKKAFDKYCEEQSGKVKKYNLKDKPNE